MPQRHNLSQAEIARIKRNMTRVDPNYQGPTTLLSVINEEAAKDAKRRIARMDDPIQFRRMFQFWNGTLDEIYGDADPYQNGYDDIGLSQMAESDYETDEAKVNTYVKQVVTEFLTNLSRRRGLLLTYTAKTKVVIYAGIQYFHGVRLDASSLEIMFDRLAELEAFAPEDVRYFPDQIVKEKPAPTPKPTLTEQIENLNLERDEDRAKVKNLIAGDYYENIVGPVWRRWQDWLATTYEIRLEPEAKEFIIKVLVPKLGLRFDDDRTWDTVRLWLAKHRKFGFSWDTLSEHEQRKLQNEGDIESARVPIDRMTPRERHRLLYGKEL